MKYYPLASLHGAIPHTLSKGGIKGKKTGAFRPPKRGEWYLSGAVPECYEAPNDLTYSYHIVKLVRIKTTIIETEVK